MGSPCAWYSMSSTTHGTEDRSYLQRLQNLKYAYPALASLDKIENTTDEDRKLVQKLHLERYGRLPGRCALLTFNERAVEHREFLTPNELDDHLQNAPSDGLDEHHRLWILEDLEPAWVNVVGARLGVDPLVFAEQMRTWNFTDSKTIPACKLPSMIDPAKSFTLKYYEIRSLSDGESIDWLRNQMTFAVNTRRYERWRDVDTKSFTNNWRQAFVRRCVSFWTNERASTKGWDGERVQMRSSCFIPLLIPVQRSYSLTQPSTPSNGATPTLRRPTTSARRRARRNLN